jgi:hypothetical protein
MILPFLPLSNRQSKWLREATPEISRGQRPWSRSSHNFRPGRDGGNAWKTKRIPSSFQDARIYWMPLPGTMCRANLHGRSATRIVHPSKSSKNPKTCGNFRSTSRSRSVLECAPQTGRFAGRMHSRKRQKSVSFQDARAIQEKQDGLPACPKVPVPKDLRHFVGGRVLESGGIPPHSKMLARFLERKAVAKRLGVRPAHGAL